MTCLANTRWLVLKKVLFVLLTTGTVGNGHAELIEKAAIDKATVSGIVFTLSSHQLGSFAQYVDSRALSQQVSDNLAQWHYPMGVSGNASHRLSATLGTVQTDTTPVGFSFSSGDSDPRGGGFQKAQVIPISCELASVASPAQQAKFNTTTSANRFFSGSQPTADLMAKLSDEISTVCFNLLEGLALQPPAPLSETASQAKPSWLPNVSIEVKNVPNTPPAKPTASQSVTAVPATAAVSAESAESLKAPLENPRKQIIIHNQGTPIILEFGHQRR